MKGPREQDWYQCKEHEEKIYYWAHNLYLPDKSVHHAVKRFFARYTRLQL